MSAPVSTTKHLNERLDFVGLVGEERAALVRARPAISASLDAALDKFYAKATAVPETAKFFARQCGRI